MGQHKSIGRQQLAAATVVSYIIVSPRPRGVGAKGCGPTWGMAVKECGFKGGGEG